jgi:hypothetical protein
MPPILAKSSNVEGITKGAVLRSWKGVGWYEAALKINRTFGYCGCETERF